MVTISWTWGSTRQTHTVNYVTSAPAKFAIASSTSSSTTTTTTGDSSLTVYASVRSPTISAPRGQSYPTSSKSQRTRRSIYSSDPSRDEEPHSPGPSSKRSRTASASAPRRSRRPFTVFYSKRAGRPSKSPSAACKHYCHAILRHGRKCLSPCARKRPGHYHCRCARHRRQ